MTGDQRGLHVTQQLVELIVTLDQLVVPDVIADRIILAEHKVFLQQLGIIVGQDEVDPGAVFDRLEQIVVHIARHIQRGSRKLNRAVQDNAHERHRRGRIQRTAALQRDVQHLVDVLPGVNIALVAHNAGNIGLHSRKELFGELLCVIAVVRLVTVKVGVEGIADGGNGDRLRIVLQIVLCKLRVELAVNRRRNAQRIVGHIRLKRRIILTQAGITVVNRLDNVTAQLQTVERLLVVHIREIEVRINAEALLLRICKQIFIAALAACRLLPLQLGRDGGIHAAVGVAVEAEVDVGDTRCRQLIIDGLDVIKRGQRLIDGGRHGENLLDCLRDAEGLNVQRDIRLDVCVGQAGERAVIHQVITVCTRHAHPGCLVIILDVIFLCCGIIRQHNVLDLVAADILTVGNDFNRAAGTDRDRIRQHIGVLGSRVDRELYRVVIVQLVLMLCCDTGKRVAFLNDGEEAAVFLHANRLFDGDGLLDLFGGHFTGLGIGDFHRLGVGFLAGHILDLLPRFNDTVDRHTHDVLVGCALQRLICEVGTVNRAGNRSVSAREVRIVHQRAAAVRNESIAFICIGARAHVRQNRDILQLVERLIKTDTVCGKRNNQTVLGERIFQ